MNIVFFCLFMGGQPISEYFSFLIGHYCSINENTTKNFLLKKPPTDWRDVIFMWRVIQYVTTQEGKESKI